MRNRIVFAIAATFFALALATSPNLGQTSASRTLTITAQADQFVVLDITPNTQTCIFDASNIGQIVTCGTSTVSWQTRCTNGASISSLMGSPTPANIQCTGQPSQSIPPGYQNGSVSVTCTAFHDQNLSAGTYSTTLAVALACN